MNKNVTFFDEQKEQSAVKAAIVAKYFGAWAKVIIGAQKAHPHQAQSIAYIDLFAGPGRYKDGSKSTPLMVLEKAIADSDMRQRLVTIFNDGDHEHISSLAYEISTLPNIEHLTHPPIVRYTEVGENIVKELNSVNKVPTLMFIDPFGYKGLSLQLINSALRDWGCDCIFFFNYNRISLGLPNEAVKSHMDALFEGRVDSVRQKIQNLDPHQRELTIIEELVSCLKETATGNRFVLPFRFRNEVGSRTSHHLIFASKHFRGYEIMKDIMHRESSSQVDGVASFEYNPADRRQPQLFRLTATVEDLKKEIVKQFAGRKMTVKSLYEAHSVDTPFVLATYKEVLNELEDAKEIQANPPADKRPMRLGKRTMADTTTIIFP